MFTEQLDQWHFVHHAMPPTLNNTKNDGNTRNTKCNWCIVFVWKWSSWIQMKQMSTMMKNKIKKINELRARSKKSVKTTRRRATTTTTAIYPCPLCVCWSINDRCSVWYEWRGTNKNNQKTIHREKRISCVWLCVLAEWVATGRKFGTTQWPLIFNRIQNGFVFALL